ncbi:MAG: elongation factor G [Candidatus Velthaea sp.]
MTDISRLRNVAFVGPHHAGKTTLVEAVLARCGAIARRGSVHNGTTITDCEPESIEHVQSVCTGFAHTECGDVDITIVDTPGFIDFFEETKIALLAVDAAVIVVDAEPSRVAQTAALVEYLEMQHMPHLFFINKLDRPGADFEATLRALRDAYGPHVVAEHLPIGSGESLRGYIDLARSAAYAYDADGNEHATDIPAELGTAYESSRQVLLEALADFDDHLMEQLLEGVEPSKDEIDRDLCEECAHDQIIAVLAGCAHTGAGTAALIDAIARLFPSPLTQPRRDIDGREIAPRDDGPVVAQVCKTIIHPQAGKLSVARVFTGTLSPQSPLVDASRSDAPVKPGLLYRLFGKKQEPVERSGPGTIVAIARLDGVGTGDTLTSPGANTIMPSVPASDPVFAIAIKPREKLDESKLSQMLARLVDEDPALRVIRAEFTNELHLVGNGEMHVATATERLSRKYNLALETHPPTVPYRETIRTSTEMHSRYKHQTGGHGQFADVKLRIEPCERGHGVTFSEAIVGGAVPKQFFSAVERGVREALMHGPACGFPVVDVHVTLIDGGYHAVDSSEAAFRTAAGMAIRDAVPKCGPVVLEPLVHVDVLVPTDYVSAAIQQLTAKRAQILGFDASERRGFDIVHALVPQAELARYITELRTATAGFGTYSWHHERFEVAPDRIAARSNPEVTGVR